MAVASPAIMSGLAFQAFTTIMPSCIAIFVHFVSVPNAFGYVQALFGQRVDTLALLA